MKTFTCKLSSLALFTLCAFAASPSVVAGAAPIQPSACIILFDLVYLKAPGGPVDVTSSMYTSQGQTYAVLNNVPVPIVVNNGNVYSPSGSVIGYTVHVVQ